MNNQEIEILQPPVLFDQTQAVIDKIEGLIDMPLVVYWNSFNGAVCPNDVVGFYNLFKKIGKHDKIALFIKSDGGNIESALRIVNIIRNYTDHCTALIPLEAASSATLMTLGADEIQMGPLSYLTPIDSSQRHALAPIDPITNNKVFVSQNEVERIDAMWHKQEVENAGHHYEELYKYLHPLVLGSLDRASSLSIKIGSEILSYHMDDDEECLRISQVLNNDFPSHSYPIMLKEAKEIGLNVKAMDEKLNELLLELNAIYSEMGNKAFTDFDEFNYHDNQILNILEARGLQLYYQNDRDWSYIKEERRWQVLNDNSYWYKVEHDENDKIIKNVLYIS